MNDIISLIQSLGFPTAVAVILILVFIKLYKDQNDFIKDKLIKIIENNTKALENLIYVINEMRHEIENKYKLLEDSLREQRDLLIELKSRLNPPQNR